MDEIARLSTKDRADLFAAAAAKRGVTTAIMEKDFWVCWTLRRIFSLPDPPARLIFKGGTSLSKVYGAIERFSEDVDLAFDRADLGFTGDKDPTNAPSNNKRQKALKELNETCMDLIQGDLRNRLIDHFAESLKSEPGEWALELDDVDPLALNFAYPQIKKPHSAAEYVKPAVKLELGARSDHWPAEDAQVIPYVAEVFPDQVADPVSKVRVLSGSRTFWEKATILHQWCHAPEDKKFPDRQSRHYYDLARLAEHEIGEKALNEISLLADVADHKEIFFEAKWAKYDLARPGTLKLIPPPERISALKDDYSKMHEMIFGEVPDMEHIIETLQSLEARINASKTDR